MTELVECNTQLHKTLQGLWSDALTQHKLQQQPGPLSLPLDTKTNLIVHPLWPIDVSMTQTSNEAFCCALSVWVCLSATGDWQLAIGNQQLPFFFFFASTSLIANNSYIRKEAREEDREGEMD